MPLHIFYKNKSVPPLPICSSPTPTTGKSVLSMNLFFFLLIFNSTYKREHMVCVLLFLTHFIYHNDLKVYPCFCKWQGFILFMAKHSSTLYVYVYLPICLTLSLSINRHLSSFHILAIVNNGALYMECTSFQVSSLVYSE